MSANDTPMKKNQIASAPAALRAPSQTEIAPIAYRIWQSRGCPEGQDQAIWLEAERSLQSGASGTARARRRVEASEDADELEERTAELLEETAPPARRSATAL